MSELKYLVPPLELCKLIPEGKFTDSVFEWYIPSKVASECGNVPNVITRHYSAASGLPGNVPAPTTDEIQEKLANHGRVYTRRDADGWEIMFENPGDDEGYGYAAKIERNSHHPAAAALRQRRRRQSRVGQSGLPFRDPKQDPRDRRSDRRGKSESVEGAAGMRDYVGIESQNNSGNIVGKNSGNILQQADVLNFSVEERRKWALDYLREWCVYSSGVTTTFSNNAIKTCLLLNGMACVAILAFLGHLSENGADVTHAQIYSLLCFAIGCAAVVPCLYLSYCAQSNFTHSLENLVIPVQRKTSQSSQEELNRGNVLNYLAIVCGGFSMVLFIVGVIVFAVAMW